MCSALGYSACEHVVSLTLAECPLSCSPQLLDLPRRMCTSLGMVRVSCWAAFSRRLSEVQEFAKLEEFSFHWKCQAVLAWSASALARRSASEASFAMDASHFLQSSPSLREVEFPFSKSGMQVCMTIVRKPNSLSRHGK